jgi:hypothetical protein
MKLRLQVGSFQLARKLALTVSSRHAELHLVMPRVAFVQDMRSQRASLHALAAFQRARKKKLRLAGVKQLVPRWGIERNFWSRAVRRTYRTFP